MNTKTLSLKNLLLLALLALLINACKRNELAENPTSAPFARKGLTIGDSVIQVNCDNYSFLKFKNREAFINTLIFLADNSVTSDSILDDFDAAFLLATIRDDIEQLANDSLKFLAYGDVTEVLAAVVSADSIIQIDSMAFLLDFDDSSIYEMYPVTCSNLSILKQKQEVNNDSMYIFRYNFHDPVFHPSGYEEEEEFQRRSWFRWRKKVFGGCEDIWAERAEDIEELNYNVYISSTTQKAYSYYIEHRYRHYAVYFEIKHKWLHNEGSLTYGSPYAIPVSMSHQDNWKEYCGSWGSHANWPNSIFGNNSEFDFKTYKSTNSLARNKNQIKTYVWFYPQGTPIFPMTSPNSVPLKDLNF